MSQKTIEVQDIEVEHKDKKTELMIFATGNIYRETGTASKHVKDNTFSINVQLEKKNLKTKPECKIRS